MATIFEIQLPAVYLDNLVEDNAPAVIGLVPTVINCDPEQSETKANKSTDIQLDLATLDPSSGTVDTSATQVFVNGVLAFSGGTFETGFDGGASAHSNPQADVLRIIIDPTADFDSEEVVTVRVVSKATGDAGILDTSYTFTVEDYAPPQLVSAAAQDLQRVRVTFNEDVVEADATDATSATDPANYMLDRLGDYLTPVVSANVTAVMIVTSKSVDLLTDIALTPGGNYQVTATNLEDVSGNPIAAPDNVGSFTGWVPPQPAGRSIDLYQKLPLINRQEDDSQDLYRFVACIQEVVILFLWDIDRFLDILDPDVAPEQWVDAMLADLGNPFEFEFELALTDKRRLAQILTNIYQLKGTRVGIIDVIRFFMSLEVTIDEFNVSTNTWVLGDSDLGDTTILGTDVSALLYSFTVTVQIALTDTQRGQLTDIVNYMKPAHTHFIELIEPVIPDVLDHLELGLSELGENWMLH